MLLMHDPGLLDTNLFDRVLDGGISENFFDGHELWVTHVQIDELCRAPEPRRSQLLGTLKFLSPSQIPTAGAVWDISSWDGCKWASDDSKSGPLLQMLQTLDRASRKRCDLRNQRRDVLIAETAITQNFVLLSDDENLRRVTLNFGGDAVSIQELGQPNTG